MKRTIFLFATLFCCIAHATETTKWYIEGSVYATTTCESGDDVTMPATLPEKFGYTFQGWMPAVYDMSTLDYTLAPTDTSACDNYNQLCTIVFDYGTVYMKTKNSSQSDSAARLPEETPAGSGQYCWIQITGFKPTGSDIIYEPLQKHWTYCNADTGGSASNRCATSRFCSGKITNATNGAAFRKKLFGID